MSYYYAMALVSVALTTCAQLLLKGGTRSGSNGASDPLFLAKLILFTPMIWGGILAMGLSLISWIVALTRLDVSKAYQFTSLGIVLTMFGGSWFFQEPMSTEKFTGSVIIMIGVLIVAQS